jgi:ethanolamine utilization protein EutM
MTQWALGLIEVIGLPPALEAADTCLKSANIHLIGYEKVTSGFMTVKIQGDVGAVKAAIEAAKVSAAKIGPVVSTLVIPRPAEGIHGVIYSSETVSSEAESTQETEIIGENGNVTEEQSSKESEIIEDEQQNEVNSEQSFSCNLCHDPNCPREKGQPRKQCIHNKENQ